MNNILRERDACDDEGGGGRGGRKRMKRFKAKSINPTATENPITNSSLRQMKENS